MKKLLAILLLAGVSSPAMANLSIRHQSSLQHTVDAQQATYSRMGNSYSISGTNVTTTHTPAGDGASAVTNGIGINSYSTTTGVGTIGSITGTQSGSGSFSFSQSFTQGDIAGTSSEYSDFGSVSITSAGTQNSSTNAPGTITNAHAITLTGTGNIGTATTGQFVTEVTAF